jgi:lysozyme
MNINQAGTSLIEKWEGFYDHAYDDGEGVWTIGYGTTRWDMKTPVKKGETITREVAEIQLQKELQRVQDAIDTSIRVPLSSNEYSSLCSIFYNIGTGWCTGKGHAQASFVKNLNNGRKDLVPAGMLQFTRGANTGTHYDGLLNRRKDEVKLWLTPDSADDHAEVAATPAIMPQAVSPTPVMTATQAVRSSPTIGAASVGLLAGIGKAGSSVWDWITDAGQQIGAAKEASGPFGELFKALHINMETVCLTIIVGSLSFVILRHIGQKREGTSL